MPTDRLSATFSALADPTRRAILARLALGETSVTELAEPFDMSLPAVSKHLKVLERAGLIVRGREAQWRPCRIEANALKGVDDWLEDYRRLWEEALRSPGCLPSRAASKGEKAWPQEVAQEIASIPCRTRGRSSRRAYSTRRATSCSKRSPIRNTCRGGGDRSAFPPPPTP